MVAARRHEVHRKATLFSCRLPPYILHGHHVPPSQLPPPFPSRLQLQKQQQHHQKQQLQLQPWRRPPKPPPSSSSSSSSSSSATSSPSPSADQVPIEIIDFSYYNYFSHLFLALTIFSNSSGTHAGRLEEGQDMISHSNRRPPLDNEVAARKKVASGRRMMIGSTAPICTYECRGCRFKCSAEQVPVDAGDPMNSAYRYRCVCHR